MTQGCVRFTQGRTSTQAGLYELGFSLCLDECIYGG